MQLATVSDQSSKKKNSTASCDHCRANHLRCVKSNPADNSCVHCSKKGVECIFSPHKKRGPQPGIHKRKAILEQEVEEWKTKYLKLLSMQGAINPDIKDIIIPTKVQEALMVTPILREQHFVLTRVLNDYLEMYLFYLQPVYRTKYQVRISGEMAQFLLTNDEFMPTSDTVVGMHLNTALAFGARMRCQWEDAKQLIDKARHNAAEVFDKGNVEVASGLVLMATFFLEGGDRVRSLHYNSLAQSMCKALGLTQEKHPHLWNQISSVKVQSILQQGTAHIKENKPKLHKLLQRMEVKSEAASSAGDKVCAMLMRATTYICSCLFPVDEPPMLTQDGNIMPQTVHIKPEKMEPVPAPAPAPSSTCDSSRTDRVTVHVYGHKEPQSCTLREYFQCIVDLIDQGRQLMDHARDTMPKILQLTTEIEFNAYSACVLWRYSCKVSPASYTQLHEPVQVAPGAPLPLSAIKNPQEARSEAIRIGVKAIELTQQPEIGYCLPHMALPLEQLAYMFLEANEPAHAEKLLSILYILSNTHPMVNQNVQRLKNKLAQALSNSNTLEQFYNPPSPMLSSAILSDSNSNLSNLFAPAVTLSPVSSPVYTSSPSALVPSSPTTNAPAPVEGTNPAPSFMFNAPTNYTTPSWSDSASVSYVSGGSPYSVFGGMIPSSPLPQMLSSPPDSTGAYTSPVDLVESLRNSGTLPDLWGEGTDLVIADDDFLKVVGDGPLFMDDSDSATVDAPTL